MTPMELECRVWDVDRLEIRGHGADQVVRGQGVPYDRLSEDMGGWREVIRKGAASDSLKNNDIAMLWAHDTAQPVSRVSASRHALVLEERKSGVWFEQAAAAFSEFQLQKISDGVVQKMSFGFFIENHETDQTWHQDKKPVLREIHKLNLRELSPVVFPAYPSTKVALRSAADRGIVLSGRPRASGVGRTPPPRHQDPDAGRRELERDMARLAAVAEHGIRRQAKPPATRRPAREWPCKSAFEVLLGHGVMGPLIRVTATHESGHAIVGILSGQHLDSVALHFERVAFQYSWRFTGGRCLFRDNADVALIHVAGAVAEGLACFSSDIVPSEWRREDDGRAKDVTRVGIQAERRTARSLLVHHWAAVRALSAALLERQVIPGDEAEAIILQHLDVTTRDRLRRRVA